MWYEFDIKLPDALKEPVTAVLYELGCQGVQEEHGSLTAYFPVTVSVEGAYEALSAFENVSVAYKLIDEQDWYASWKEKFRPVHAEGLVICPPWLECVSGPGERQLILDPAQAFGAGDHVTTLTVLGMLRAWALSRSDLERMRFLDLGTGTGILTVAACIYGLGEVTAVDTEPSAVEAARRNFELNAVAGRARIIRGSIKEAGSGFDLIAANLYQESLLEIMPRVPAALNAGGSLLVSGLLADQEQPVFQAAGDAGLEVVETVGSAGWISARLFFRGKTA